MSDPFRKWAQGDEWEPSASQLNAWTDAARFAQQSLSRPTAGDGQLFQPFTPLRMRNATGEAIPRLGVVSYSGPTFNPSSAEDRFVQDFTIEASKPSAEPLWRFAIALQRVEIDAVFFAAIGGVVPCRVTGRGESVTAITADMEKLQAGGEGVPLLWSQGGDGERFGICRIDEGIACSESYDLRLLWSPAEATMWIDVLFDGVTETIEFNKFSTRVEVKAAVDAHSKFVEHEVECQVYGAGEFPSSNMLLTLPAGAKITGKSATLVRADLNPHPEWRVDICGCRS